MRQKTAKFWVIMNVGGFVKVVLPKRAAISHDQRRRVEDSGLHEGLDHILIERHDRQSVLVAFESVDRVGQVELQIESAFGGRHHLVFLARHNHPLALLAVANHV